MTKAWGADPYLTRAWLSFGIVSLQYEPGVDYPHGHLSSASYVSSG